MGKFVLAPVRTIKLSPRDPRSLSDLVDMGRAYAFLMEEVFRRGNKATLRMCFSCRIVFHDRPGQLGAEWLEGGFAITPIIQRTAARGKNRFWNTSIRFSHPTILTARPPSTPRSAALTI